MTSQNAPNPADYTPSLDRSRRASIAVATSVPDSATAIGVLVSSGGDVPVELGLDRPALQAAGFDGALGSALLVPAQGRPVHVAVGTGNSSELTATALRDAGAAFARAAGAHESLALHVGATGSVPRASAAQALTEGALLARYRYDVLRSESKSKPLRELTLIEADNMAAKTGIARGLAFAAATALARDLANTPHSHLNASRLADIAVVLGGELGFDVEVFDKDDLVEIGIGGLIGVNAGSAQPPRMVKLTYAPSSPSGHLALVGKGIMYDSGGISLKPGDQVHAAMKNDMSGVAAILAAVAELAEMGSTTRVTAYLMCTDSMPSGTAMAMGDVITIRGGTTIEVVNTDAEGRLVMADGLVLAREDSPDAIVDIATLTGASMRALGTEVAAVFGTDQSLVDQIKGAGDVTTEPVWQMPLYKPYRKQLESNVADMKNLGYGEGGAITAALFLAEFVDGVPWAHIDMAGTALSEDALWRTAGCSGFGARLLLQLALDFRPPNGGTQ